MVPATTVHAVSAYGAGGASTRVRLYDWLSHLGIQATRHDYLGLNANPPAYLARHPLRTWGAERDIRRCDLTDKTVIISREVSPLSSGTLERRFLTKAGRGVFDFDDAIFVPTSPVRRALCVRKKFETAVAAADFVIAGSEYLADAARPHNGEVHLVPSCIEPGQYVPKTDWSIGGDPTIVWLGSRTTEWHLTGIADALTRVHQLTGARLKIISSPQQNQELGPLERFTVRIPWSPSTVATELASSDVAVAPLSTSAYSLGKCAYKLLQYAATALPVVGAPTGANAQALERICGIQAKTNRGWVDSLVDLLAGPNRLRETMGRAALQGVTQHYSYAAWAPEWSRIVGVGGPPS